MDEKGVTVRKDMTFYKEYENDHNNDIKQLREEFDKKKEQIPNNTFMKLFNGQ